MNPENSMERKRMKSRFLLIYIVSIGLMGLIFAALWPAKSVPAATGISKSYAEEKRISDADYALHFHLKKLQSLDEESLNLYTDSAYENNAALLREKLEQLDSSINMSEETITVSIDNLSALGKSLKETKNRNYADSLVDGFNIALKNHRTLKNIRSVIGMNTGKEGDNAEAFAKWQAELSNKDKQIAKLESQIKSIQSEKKYDPVIAQNSIANDLSLKQAEGTALLLKENKALHQDNDRLLLEIGRIRKMSETAVVEKETEMRRKVNNLTSQLYLAQVDCNLTRADAKNIVYNSRQRKDLLAEAMKVLNNLSGTGDENFQQQVKEKTSQLQYISNTIRD